MAVYNVHCMFSIINVNRLCIECKPAGSAATLTGPEIASSRAMSIRRRWCASRCRRSGITSRRAWAAVDAGKGVGTADNVTQKEKEPGLSTGLPRGSRPVSGCGLSVGGAEGHLHRAVGEGQTFGKFHQSV
jgi:hypothetical protein